MPRESLTPKAEETAQRIMDAALELFRQDGFEAATMREIAKSAGVATGAAYYYYPSKEAIILDFYRRASQQMQPAIQEAVDGASGLEARLRECIRAKMNYFAANRGVLRALLRNGADPASPLSPFSRETREIRETDIAWFGRVLDGSGVRIPRDLTPRLPGLLWFFQMGVIYFWVTDDSPHQDRSARLLELSAKSVAGLIRLAGLPGLRVIRKTAIELIEIVAGAHGGA